MTSLVDLNGLSLAEIEALMEEDDALAEAVRKIVEPDIEDQPPLEVSAFNSVI